MIIACPICQARFELDADPSLVSGRQMQCGRCGNIWHHFPSLAAAPPPLSAPPPQQAIAAPQAFTQAPPPQAVEAPALAAPSQPPGAQTNPPRETGEIAEAINDAIESEENSDTDSPPNDQTSAGDEDSQSDDDAELAALRKRREQLDEDPETDDSDELEALRKQRSELDEDPETDDSDELEALRKQRARLDGDDEDDDIGNDQLENELADISSLASNLTSQDYAKSLMIPKKERKVWHFLLWFLIIGSLAGGAISGVIYRQEVMEFYPKSSSFYRMVGLAEPPPGSGLAVENIQIKNSFENGQKLLSIHADLVNISNEERVIPSLRAALEGKDGNELQHWIFNLKKKNLLPGEIVPFKTMTNNPPQGIVSLSITFAKKSPSDDPDDDQEPDQQQSGEAKQPKAKKGKSKDTEKPKTDKTKETKKP